MGRRGWFSKEWKRRKREIRKIIRWYKRGKIEREKYLEETGDFNEWCKKEREKYETEEEWKRNAITTKAEAWKYINRFRKKREGGDEEISIEDWNRHFMELLVGKNERITLKLKDGGGELEQREERYNQGK